MLPSLPLQYSGNTLNKPIIKVTQNTAYSGYYQLYDSNGNTIVLDEDHNTVTILAKESYGAIEEYFNEDCTVEADGTIGVTLASTLLTLPGVFPCEFTISTDGDITSRYTTYLNVEKTLTQKQTWDPLTVDFVRQLTLDRGAQDNDLLLDIEFSDFEICENILRVANDWNTSPPPSDNTYTQITFPYKIEAAQGVYGYLMRNAGIRLQRNRIALSTAGVQADDKQRADLYLKLGDSDIKYWKQWVLAQKQRENINGFYRRVDIVH